MQQTSSLNVQSGSPYLTGSFVVKLAITQVAIDGHVIDEKMMLGFHDCPLGTRQRFGARNRKLIDTSEFSEGSYPLVISVQIDRVIDQQAGMHCDRQT